jgi:hypothetical protein
MADTTVTIFSDLNFDRRSKGITISASQRHFTSHTLPQHHLELLCGVLSPSSNKKTNIVLFHVIHKPAASSRVGEPSHGGTRPTKFLLVVAAQQQDAPCLFQ